VLPEQQLGAEELPAQLAVLEQLAPVGAQVRHLVLALLLALGPEQRDEAVLPGRGYPTQFYPIL